MDLTNIPLMSALKKRMQWLHTNQSVLSQNVANADTPGYKTQRLQKQDFSGLVDELSGGGAPSPASRLRTTNERHISSAGGSVDGNMKPREEKGIEESPSGNSVVLEEEMLKVADNQMEYGLMVNLYRKNMGLLRLAIGKSNNA